MRSTVNAALLFALAPAAALAKINTYYFKQFAVTGADDAPPTRFAELPIDHFKSNAGTFRNRYWFNSTFYTAGGPVIVQDIGEDDAEGFTTFLQEPQGIKTAVMQLAEKYHGIGLVWEHRYYGKSVPFVQDGRVASVAALNADQWSYHTFEQALEDVVVFANNFTLPNDVPEAKLLKSPDALHASKTPWLFIGGSYPGVRAATLRARNPETIFASWSSSAPVQAQVNMASYYQAIERAIPQNCSDDFSAALKFYDAAVTGSNATLESRVKNGVLSAASGGPVSVASTDAMDDVTVGEYLLAPWGKFQTGGLPSILPFCDYFETAGGQVAPSSTGLSGRLTTEQLFGNLLITLQAEMASLQGGSTDGGLVSIAQSNRQLIRPVATPANSIAEQLPPDSLSWEYQFCSEFGYFQVGDATAQSNIITTLETVDEIQKECNAIFPGMLPSAPQVDNINKYGGWKTNPTQVLFTNGELDPWRTLSVASEESNAPKRKATTTVPGFGSKPSDDSYYGVIYSGQVHAVDFFSSTGQPAARNQAFNTGLKMFTDGLDQWLPQFKAGTAPVITTPTGTATGKAANTPTNSAGDASGTGKPSSGAASVGSHGLLVAAVAMTVTRFLW